MAMATLLDKDVRAELAATVRAREQELQSMYAILNIGVPINQLPVELLVEVFTHLQQGDLELRWLDALRVCRHWFVVGSTAAKLWKNLNVSGSTNLLRTGLARSRAAELNISITPYMNTLLEVTGLINPHLHRLRTLELGMIPPKDLPAFAIFMENAMPSLQSLQVSINRVSGLEVALDLSPTRFPRLRDVDCSGVQILRNSAIASQLHKVIISDCLGKNPQLQTSALLDAICNMRNTKELLMQHVYVYDVARALAVPAQNRVVLEQLEKVMIYTDGPLLKAILSVIVIPPTAAVSFICPFAANTSEGNASSFYAVIPDDRRGLPILSQIIAVRVTAMDSEHTFEGFNDDFEVCPSGVPCGAPQLELSIVMRSEEDVDFSIPIGLDDLVHVFCDTPLEHLTIDTTLVVAATSDWRTIFEAFPTLRTFSITVEQDDEISDVSLQLFSALDPGDIPAAALARGASGERLLGARILDAVPCPALRHLRIIGLGTPLNTDRLLDTAVTCLENRRRVLDRPGEGIRELKLELDCHDDDAHFRRVQAAFETHLGPLVDVISYQTGDMW
ncbi:hypothetical protein TRAPUB_14388 [Trametes pubescens]|uniref:F-box domain-containing protein n=1 Tax=Trametes pubescens TaxID=154538 RepID=A0A1M2VNN1_TRAPU|nr:hypothetical protein TRAPUB_14388 [Trametes pubescens]